MTSLIQQKDRLFFKTIFLILFKSNPAYCCMGKLCGKPVTHLCLKSFMVLRLLMKLVIRSSNPILSIALGKESSLNIFLQ